MKAIRTIIKSTMLIATITLTTSITVLASDLNTYNTTVTKTDNNIVYVSLNNNEYYFYEDELNDFNTNDKIIVTLENNEITGAKPDSSNIDIKEVWNIGTPSNVYVDKLTTDAELTEYSKQWLMDNYNLTLDVPVTFNKIYNTETMSIEGMVNFIDNKATEVIIDTDLANTDNYNNINCEKTLIHELTHLALMMQSKEHNDNSITFETECLKNGSSINRNGSSGILHSHVLINQNI